MYNSNEKIFETIELKLKNNEFKNREELEIYLLSLKDRGSFF